MLSKPVCRKPIPVLVCTALCLLLSCGHSRNIQLDIERSEFANRVDRLDQSGDIEKLIDSLAQPLIASGRNIGMVIGVTTPEGDVIKSYGRVDRDSDKPMPVDAVFQIGSITKSFAAVLMAKYELEGHIKIDDPISKLLLPRGLVKPENDMNEITYGQLASHTAGLKQEAYTLELLWGVSSYLLTGDNLYRYYNTKTLTDWFSSNQLTAQTEVKYAYSNIGMTLLGWLMGKLENKGLRYHLHDRILDPLGMTHTDITLTAEDVAKLTPGYSGDLPTFLPRHRRVNPWLFDEGIAGSGGLHSTAGDLLKYCKAAIGTAPEPLAKAFRRTQQIVTTQPDGEMSYSWFVERLPQTRQKYHHIAGIIGGHTSWVGYDVERKIGVVLLQNSINHDDQLSVPLLDHLVAARLKKDANIARQLQHETGKEGKSAGNSKSGTPVRR
jgi:CubicO group peptidase (beta-lactamase class C family)